MANIDDYKSAFMQAHEAGDTEAASALAQKIQELQQAAVETPYQRKVAAQQFMAGTNMPAESRGIFEEMLAKGPATEEQVKKAQNLRAADVASQQRMIDLRNMALEGTGMALGSFGGIPGAAAGFAAGRQAIYALDQNRLPTATDEAVRALKDVGKGAFYDVGGRALMAAPGAVSRAWANLTSPEIKASNLLRSVVGPTELANIQAANLRQPNVLASQAAANVPNVSGFQTLVREAELTDPLEIAAKARSATERGHEATLDILAGGPNETTRQATRAIEQNRLNTSTAPLREQAMTGAQASVAKAGEQKALQLDEAIRQNPLSVDKITSAIDAKLSNPEYGMNAQLRPALVRIKNMLTNFADRNSIISAEALYAARKNGITSEIESMENLDPTAKQKLAAKILNDLKPVLDDAITQAGGKDWAKYLEQYTTGSRKIEQKDLFGKLSDLYKTNKQAFVDLVKGDDIKTIQDIFGYGEYDIQKALGDKYSSILKMANHAESEIGITSAANKGGKIVSGAVEDKSTLNKLSSLFGGKIALANKFVEGLKGNVSKSTMDAITAASRSGASMNELLATLPYNQQQELMKAFRNSKFAGAGLNVLANQLQGQQ
jgi:hypothetical protein